MITLEITEYVTDVTVATSTTTIEVYNAIYEPAITIAPGYTIDTLPTPTGCMIVYITDGDLGLTWGATAINSGAGATPYLVWYNGTAWTVIGK